MASTRVVVEERNPFRGRIAMEPAILETGRFRVVADRDPVSEGHVLVYPKRQAQSLADSAYVELPDVMRELEATTGKRYSLFERGRVQICTSFGTDVHAHAHLVPLDQSRCLPKIAGAERRENLALALASLSQRNGEYLLWGDGGGEFSFATACGQLPKRFIRSLFKSSAELLSCDLAVLR